MLAGVLPDNILDPVTSALATSTTHLIPAFSRLVPELPAEAWWLPLLILVLLGITALIDTFEGRVPDPPIFIGLLIATAAQGFYKSWPFAAERLGTGIGVAIGLYLLNQLYYAWKQRDALGMGDAKWTMLAIAIFGINPLLIAWPVGASLGLIWLIAAWIVNETHRMFSKSKENVLDRVHFTPFLLIGLLSGLYWIYWR